MVIVNYFTCDKSTNGDRMVIVNYFFTCDKSVQWVKNSASQISKSELFARSFFKCRILSMSSVSFKCLGNGLFPHPQVGVAVKQFLISLYSKVKSKSAEATTT
jgi:hypothetical protein